ncbi:retrovirus-related pol polyprotein from transposon TNT 1-94 [Tanacetum coccineum]|uniref:Retrovirus-related pol polyprotein from transposon TNT 1-94 n=1 Tax=Tanacetum coccineum TaxID=301880 RepID=A0ABQ5EEC4_9ASTR
MSTLAEFMILSSGGNRPPMLEKRLYDSWKSIMEFTCKTEIMTKKYEELSATKKIQADCDLKATNIIFQGLSSVVYSLQEKECKLYDAFDKFAHIKGGSLHQYYLRFTQLINDMNIYKMKLEQFQVNTKFLNSLPHEWSKFETDVKLVRDLHTTNFDQLNAYLEQHELHANEVRIMRERNQDPLALSPQYGSIHPTQHYSTTYSSTPCAITYPSTPYPNAYSSTVHQDACPQPQSIPQIEYTVSIVTQQTCLAEFPQIDFGLAVLVFKKGDDPIDAINKMISFLANISGTRGNNLGQQRVVKCFNCQVEGHMERQCPKPKRKRDATWFRDKVLLVEAHGFGKVLNEEQLEFLADLGVVEGQVTQTVITHNAAYQADDLDAYDSDYDVFSTAKAVLMANLSSYGSDILSEYLLETQNAAVQDTNSLAQQDVMILSVFEQLSNQVTNCNKVNKDNLIANESLSAELERYKEREKEAKNINKEIALEKKVKELDNIVCKMGQSAQTVHMLTKPQVFYDNNLKQALGFQNPFYLKKSQLIRPMLYDGSVIAKESNVISIADSKETLMLEEESRSKMLLKQNFGKRFIPKQELSDEQAFRLQTSHHNTDQSASSPVKIEASRELPKASLVNTRLKKLKYHLDQFDNMVKKRITPDALTEEEWGFKHTKAVFLKEIIPFLKTLKDIFNVFDKDLLNEATKVQTVFNQMEAAVQQYFVDK